MTDFNKKDLSEADIRTKYITPAIVKAGWSSFSQMREEYPITKGVDQIKRIRSVWRVHIYELFNYYPLTTIG